MKKLLIVCIFVIFVRYSGGISCECNDRKCNGYQGYCMTYGADCCTTKILPGGYFEKGCGPCEVNMQISNGSLVLNEGHQWSCTSNVCNAENSSPSCPPRPPRPLTPLSCHCQPNAMANSSLNLSHKLCVNKMCDMNTIKWALSDEWKEEWSSRFVCKTQWTQAGRAVRSWCDVSDTQTKNDDILVTGDLDWSLLLQCRDQNLCNSPTRDKYWHVRLGRCWNMNETSVGNVNDERAETQSMISAAGITKSDLNNRSQHTKTIGEGVLTRNYAKNSANNLENKIQSGYVLVDSEWIPKAEYQTSQKTLNHTESTWVAPGAPEREWLWPQNGDGQPNSAEMFVSEDSISSDEKSVVANDEINVTASGFRGNDDSWTLGETKPAGFNSISVNNVPILTGEDSTTPNSIIAKNATWLEKLINGNSGDPSKSIFPPTSSRTIYQNSEITNENQGSSESNATQPRYGPQGQSNESTDDEENHTLFPKGSEAQPTIILEDQNKYEEPILRTDLTIKDIPNLNEKIGNGLLDSQDSTQTSKIAGTSSPESDLESNQHVGSSFVVANGGDNARTFVIDQSNKHLSDKVSDLGDSSTTQTSDDSVAEADINHESFEFNSPPLDDAYEKYLKSLTAEESNEEYNHSEEYDFPESRTDSEVFLPNSQEKPNVVSTDNFNINQQNSDYTATNKLNANDVNKIETGFHPRIDDVLNLNPSSAESSDSSQGENTISVGLNSGSNLAIGKATGLKSDPTVVQSSSQLITLVVVVGLLISIVAFVFILMIYTRYYKKRDYVVSDTTTASIPISHDEKIA